MQISSSLQSTTLKERREAVCEASGCWNDASHFDQQLREFRCNRWGKQQRKEAGK